jgi:hypothetical protein
VKGGHHVFGSVRKRHDYSLLRPLYPVPVLLFVFFLEVQGLHSLLTALHRAGRLYQQGTMFHSGASGSATRYCLYHSLKFLIETVSVIYMDLHDVFVYFEQAHNYCHQYHDYVIFLD